MATLSIAGINPEQRSSCLWGASLLHALAREEAAGRQVPRLTEPGMPTWNRFRGRLTGHDFIGLLFEDAAVQHPIPFDPNHLKALVGEDLYEPTDETSPIYRIARKGGGLHHLAFRCNKINEEISRLKSLGLRVITNPEPGEAFENNQIAFLLGDQALNIELIDTDKKAQQMIL